MAVESANVVGVINATAEEAYSLQVASFDDIGTDTYSIQNIIPKAPDGVEIGGGAFDLQTLDYAGGMEEQFVYLTTDDGVPQNGWYEEDMETFATKVFAKGEGFMFNNSCGETAGICFAGQVSTNAVNVDATEAYSVQGNIRPYEISIQDLIPAPGAGVEIGGGAFDLQTLDYAGGMLEQFVYLTTDDGVPQNGWYEEDMETFATKTFAPSEGYLFNNSCGEDAEIAYK